MPVFFGSTPRERELSDLHSSQAVLIDVLHAHAEELQARLAELENQVKGNSKHSSRPSAPDGAVG